ncbi:1-Cys peroxiredoxin-like [Durio zibethinus]|uniref:Peroxiredoxin n=1 Tax=Durio zibethinus TaxID=66656 RepID=A0A6P5X4P4_DURZI|nr:1-Cys peroxiredoxin-like [Durio zibethinus]
MPGITLEDTVPNLKVETTHGKIKLHDYFKNGWTIIFSHAADFTLVCSTELGKMAAFPPEFEKRGAKLLALSCDDVQLHNERIKDVETYQPGCKVTYPIVADPNREIIKQLNMVDSDDKDFSGNQLPSRALHIVGSGNKIKMSFLYPSTTGRNMDEVLRALDSLLKASKYKVATPATWKPDDPVVISPSVTNEEAKEMFPQGFETKKLPSGLEYPHFTRV